MDWNEFYEAVRRMRTAQKEYFRTRAKDWLVESRRREKRVDTMLENYSTLELFNKLDRLV